MRLFTNNPYTQPLLAIPLEVLIWVGCVAALFLFWLWHSRRLDLLARGISFLPLLPLVSVVSWEHHLVVLLPVLWLGLVRLSQRAWPVIESSAFAVILLGFSTLPRVHPGPAADQFAFFASQTHNPAVFFAANGLLLCTLAVFFISPWLLRARS
jgi:hypothetical protein